MFQAQLPNAKLLFFFFSQKKIKLIFVELIKKKTFGDVTLDSLHIRHSTKEII